MANVVNLPKVRLSICIYHYDTKFSKHKHLAVLSF